jgi:Holliday junction DNA helicase RuvA
MIATLTGTITGLSGESCVILVGGVGYQVFMPLTALEALSHTQEPVTLFTHFHLREDGASLFGFLTLSDKAIFEKIIGVSGIGPKTALAILGTFSGERFRDAIQNEDYRALTGVSGVGLKTAQRLVLELKGKLTKIAPSGESKLQNYSQYQDVMTDAVDALVALGYSAKEASTAAENILTEDPNLSTPEIVRKALKNLNRK